MTKGSRIDYLDIAKGIGILLVIVGHIPYVSEPIRQYIVSFHMPLFFIISGMLIRYTRSYQGNIKSFIGRKVRNLLLPYVFFSVAYIAIEFCRILIKDTGEWNNLAEKFYQTVCLQGISVLWFFPTLFMAETVFVLVRKWSNHLITIVCLVVLVAGAVYFMGMQSNLVTVGDTLFGELLNQFSLVLIRGTFCTGLVGIGYYMGALWNERKMPVFAEGCLGVLLLVLVEFVANADYFVDLRYMRLGELSAFFAACILGSAGVLFLCRVLAHFPSFPVAKAGVYLGVNSMLIMVTHLDFHVLNISTKIANRINASLQNNIAFCLLIITLVCVFEILIIELVKRLLPFIVKRLRKIS